MVNPKRNESSTILFSFYLNTSIKTRVYTATNVCFIFQFVLKAGEKAEIGGATGQNGKILATYLYFTPLLPDKDSDTTKIAMIFLIISKYISLVL